MDESRLKKLCSKILDKHKLHIKEITVIPTNSLQDDGIWTQSSYCVFLTLSRLDNYERIDVAKILESYIGFEFIVNFS